MKHSSYMLLLKINIFNGFNSNLGFIYHFLQLSKTKPRILLTGMVVIDLLNLTTTKKFRLVVTAALYEL